MQRGTTHKREFKRNDLAVTDDVDSEIEIDLEAQKLDIGNMY